MPKLNQIIAIEKGAKANAERAFTDAYHLVQKAAPFTGISRSYTPKDDDGEQFPPESTKVQVTVESLLGNVADVLTRRLDVTATKDWANCQAKSNVTVHGQVLLEDVPVTFLLQLEKVLTDLHTFVSKLPTLDAAQSWQFDAAVDCFASTPVETNKTKKIPRNHVKAEATREHPAQVEIYTEDVVVGTWKTTHFSGALQAKRQKEMLQRIADLQQAVKYAREDANTSQTSDVEVGQRLFEFVLA